MKGIDVSTHQGIIDWEKVKGQIDFAILRIGYGREQSQKDKQFERNYTECNRLGIPVGIYLYSYAKDEAGAELEAENCLKWLDNRKIQLPIYFDIEDKSQQDLGKDKLTKMCYSFCEKIEAAGYWAGIYANKYWFTSLLNGEELGNRFTCWIAQYNNECTYQGKYDIWQNSSSGSVSGINGNVDTNIMYRDLISEIGNKTSDNVDKVDNNVQNYTTYTVKSGDILSEIAAKYNTTYQKIAADNNIADPNVIYPGQVLKINGSGTTQAKEINIGSKVNYEGYLYSDSYGSGKGKYVNGTYTVTTLIKNRAYGVNLNNGLGWVKESDCKSI